MVESDDIASQLRNAALALFAEVGYGSTTIEMIAESAGVGVATLYRRWPDKASLANDVYRATLERFDRMYDDLPGRTPKQRFLALWRRLWGFAMESPEQMVLVEGQTNAAFVSDDNVRRKAALQLRTVEALSSLGVRADPGIVSAMVMGTLVAIVRSGIKAEADDVGERLWSALRAG